MILPAMVALPTALGPLLSGSWDLWAQSLLQLAVIAGLTGWVGSRILIGFVPLPSRRTLVWTGLLVVLGAASALLSPVHGLARPEWRNWLMALWMFPAMAALSKDERSSVDEAIRVCGWILMVLAFYQRFSLGVERPASALVNQNVYAGAVLLLLPLAVEKRDWLLAFGLLWTLWWTRSVGAWLGLAAALWVFLGRRSPAWRWVGGGLAFVCAIAVYNKLGTPEVLNRWWWWKASAAMAADRPWTGWGPGAFAYVSPAYLSGGPGNLLTLYAHNFPLQTLAEYGIAFTLVWFAGLARCVLRHVPAPHKRFGVAAALVHSLWDYPLSMPANLWLFCYYAASTIPDSSEGVNIPSRNKLPAILLTAGMGLVLAGSVRQGWRADRLAAGAVTALEAGRFDEARALAAESARLSPDDAQAPQLAAAVELRRIESLSQTSGMGVSRGAWLRAAAWLERAVRLNPYRMPVWTDLSARLNPYRVSAWTQLALCYRRLGLFDAAAAVEREGASYRTRRIQ